jgi:hypothetical protein
MTTDIIEYLIVPQTPSPPDYPFCSKSDKYSEKPFAPTFEARRIAFLEFIRQNPAPTNVKAPWIELARLAGGGTPHEGILSASLDYIDARKDCADLSLHCVLRMLYQFHDDKLLNVQWISRAQKTVLEFKFWPDEPGSDSMCTWNEHHYILFASAAYLAGQLYPDQIFSNSGETGQQKMALNRSRLLRWLNLRFFTGFSEWLSHVYYDEELTALLSLTDFCQDEEIRIRATAIIDLLLFEMAINNFKGVFGSSHGRSYEPTKKWADQESTTDTQKLLFGRGVFTAVENMSAVAFALSDGYRMPGVLYEIANDQDRHEMLHRQRIGINLDQATWWDLKPNDLENGMLLLNLEAYFHPRTINLLVRMMDAFDWWEKPFFQPFARRRRLIKFFKILGLLPLISRHYERDVCRTIREEVNVYTYRTPDYMISTAQDYRKGYGGDQQHIWQATLGPSAVCFTTHPARMKGSPPNYWSGSGILPRVAQIKNVVIAIYRLSKIPSLYVRNELDFTHAWLPRDRFDDVVEKEGWIFARLSDGYLGLLSQYPYQWHEMPGEDRNREIIVRKCNNIWLCEMGCRETDGDFSTFVQRILEAELVFYDSNISYRSPSQGYLQFGWKGPLVQDGRQVPLGDYPRYASPYAQVPFPPEDILISLGEETLHIDWINCNRQANSFI